MILVVYETNDQKNGKTRPQMSTEWD